MSKNVIEYFENICKIPHGSGNTSELAAYCCKIAEKNGLWYHMDSNGNVTVKKPPSNGMENCPTVIIQGHLDMVCAKKADSGFDFEKSGIELVKNGDYISAKDTTLGADDGVAVAYALALMEDNSIACPPLEIVLTSEEEVGMTGAENFDTSDLKGKKLINIDSDREGIFTVSCAGGVNVNAVLKYKAESDDGVLCRVKLSGFKGGHSGTEINTGVLNANKIMGEILHKLQKIGIRLADIDGGDKPNAIAAYSQAAFLTEQGSESEVKDTILQTFQAFKKKAVSADFGMVCEISFEPSDGVRVMNESDTCSICEFLGCVPNGVVGMDENIEGLVKTSLNLGTIRSGGDSAEIILSLRSSDNADLKKLENKIKTLAEKFGFEACSEGAHPAWEYAGESELLKIMTDVYYGKYGEKPTVTSIHAGLECAVFADKIKGLEAISIGPDIYDIHTVNERVSVSSLNRVWEYLKDVLANMPR